MKIAPPARASVFGRLWGTRARDWAELEEEGSRPLYGAVLDAANVGRGTRYLDVACGSGLAVAIAAGRGAAAAGLDASAAMIEIARERSPASQLRIGDMERLPYGDASFDVVTMINALHLAGDEVAALWEAGRVAARGGVVAVVQLGAPAECDAAACLEPLIDLASPGRAPRPFTSPGDLERLTEEAGLTPVRSFEIETTWCYPNKATIRRAWQSWGEASAAAEDAGTAPVEEVIDRASRRFQVAGGAYKLENTFRCLIARP